MEVRFAAATAHMDVGHGHNRRRNETIPPSPCPCDKFRVQRKDVVVVRSFRQDEIVVIGRTELVSS